MLLLFLGCGGPTASDPPVTPATEPDESVLDEVVVQVTLDGDPVEGAWVGVGGGASGTTGVDGSATLPLAGGAWVIASHPEARTRAADALDPVVAIALERFDRTDNPAYVFEDPGIPGTRGNTGQCVHCHGSMVADWAASPHRDAASNPVVHDVFAGTAALGQAACTQAGGTWHTGLQPGTREAVERCYLGAGVLPDLNDDCSTGCDDLAADTGGCADCHAPGIDGVLGGRSLLEATGRAYDEGVHCDVCHKAESVDLSAPPGVAGALGLLRPSEPATSASFTFEPLFFGPFPDVPNPRMRAVPRAHFREARFCGACHESRQQALVPGQVLDPERWPDGLPVHSTYSEWEQGVYAPTSPCQSCHMPPETDYLNGADLEDPSDVTGIPSGWIRPPGSVRRHVWDGPRGTGPLLGLAAALDLEVHQADGVLEARVTTRNVGAGHALPTGEPLRSVFLRVEARCGTEPLEPLGGDVVPSFGGALDVQDPITDVLSWPGARVGDRIRVVARDGWRSYQGPGPFGDGTFTGQAAGLPLERWVGEAEVIEVDGAVVTLDGPLLAGDVAYRVDGTGLPEDGEHSRAWAGAPGFAFARVLVDAQGTPMVPHHRAIDIVSDNRLLPQASLTTEHLFAVSCPDPVVTARLLHRAYPIELARERGWHATDRLIAEVER